MSHFRFATFLTLTSATTSRRVAVAGILVLALAAGSSPSATADEQRPARKQPTVWQWDCRSAPAWRATVKSASLEEAQRTAEKFNEQKNSLGKYYAATDGATPDSTPNCQEVPAAEVNPVKPPVRRSPPVRKVTRTRPAEESDLLQFDGEMPADFPTLAAEMARLQNDFADRPAPRGKAQRTLPPKNSPQSNSQGNPLTRPAAGESTDAVPAGGKLVLLSETEQKFGKIAQGTAAKQVFQLKNAGPGDLTVQLTDKSCGCTSIRIDGQELTLPAAMLLPPLSPIPADSLAPSVGQTQLLALPLPALPAGAPTAESSLPAPRPEPSIAKDGSDASQSARSQDSYVMRAGRTVQVEIAVNTEHAHGPTRQSVKLTTSDPKSPVVELRVEGEVFPKVELSEAWLDFGEMPTEKNSRRTLQVRSQFVADLAIKQVVASHSALKVRTESLSAEELKKSGAKSGVEITVEIAAGQPIGLMQGELTIITNQADSQALSVPAMGRVTGDVQLMPSEMLDFGFVLQGQTATLGAYAKIRTKLAVGVKVSRVEPESLKVELHKPSGLSQGQQFVIVEVIVPAQTTPGEIKGYVELETTHPTAKKVRIPVRAQVMQSNALGAP